MDRVDHLGDTEALNRNFTLHFGQTEIGFSDSKMLGFHRDFTFGLTDSYNSVAPRCVTARSIAHRWLRDGSIR